MVIEAWTRSVNIRAPIVLVDLMARYAHSFHFDSHILKGDLFLMDWLIKKVMTKMDGHLKSSLIYRASRDGYTAQKFHLKCDGKSPQSC